jgi:diguanylate cyclase (GGDEF)-like protein
VDWSKLPDIIAVALLACAFASVARRGPARSSALWLTGWLLIVIHFAAFMFVPAPGNWGLFATVAGLASLTWAAILFMWAAVPYRHPSSVWMLVILLATNTLYVSCIVFPALNGILSIAAMMVGLGPLALTINVVNKFSHPLRWSLVVLNGALSIYLLFIERRPNTGPDLALDGLLCIAYLSCCVHFWYAYRRATAGAFITIAGFFAWASVFVVSPLIDRYLPQAHVEGEVWNLPKYVVAVGMILLLLEEQIRHSEHLALHDVLTGLPNRRLFQDRLSSALERARRTGTQAALLVLDLDRFKQVNDTFGHHVGDLLLQQVATIFNARMRRSDTVARTGGDEFSVILESPTNLEEAMHVGRSLQELVRQPIHLEQRSVRVGASFGVAVFPDDAADLEALCIMADSRMYDDKRRHALHEEKDPRKSPATQLPPKRQKQSTMRMPS